MKHIIIHKISQKLYNKKKNNSIKSCVKIIKNCISQANRKHIRHHFSKFNNNYINNNKLLLNKNKNNII